MKKVKFAALLLAILMVVSLMAGCNNTPSQSGSGSASGSGSTGDSGSGGSDVYEFNGLPKDEKVTITIAFWEAGYGREWFDYACEQYMSMYPNVTIEVEASPTISEMLTTKVTAGNDEDMYDLINFDWNKLAQINKVVAVDDLLESPAYNTTTEMSDKALKDVLLPGLYERLTKHTDGKHYYLPFDCYYGGFFYDNSLFEKNNWNKNPKTYSEFEELCKTIKDTGMYPIVTTAMYDYIWQGMEFKDYELALAEGGQKRLDEYTSIKQNATEPPYTLPEYMEVYERMYQWGKNGWIDPATKSINHTESQMLVLQDKVAMCPCGSWIETEMWDSTPEGFEWGFFTLPMTDDPNAKVFLRNGAQTQLVCYYRENREKEIKWAKDFYKWTLSLTVAQYFTENTKSFPIRGDYFDDPSRKENLTNLQLAILEYVDQPNVEIFSAPQSLNTKVSVQPEATQAGQVLKDACGSIWCGETEPGPVLEKAAELYQKAIDAAAKS